MIHPNAWRSAWAASLTSALLLIGAAPSEAAAQAPYRQPTITISADGRTASMRLDVLTYNLEGIPLREGRKAKLREIGQRLAAMREAGDAPDVILFQERFSDDAKSAVSAAGYPAVAGGPKRSQQRRLPGEATRQDSEWTKGELGVRVVGSGLAVASVYPISVRDAEPYSRRACAGFDCLSNKGALFVRIDIPGLPDPLDLFDTHMNAQGASGVAPPRHLSAHEAQTLELMDFIGRRHDADHPVILAGDFNMRGSAPRFSFFEDRQAFDLVHRYCAERRSDCDVRAAWQDDAPWMATQDLQLFNSGARVAVRPVHVETLFDGRAGGPKLSDHDGFRVVYELSWRVQRPEIAARPPVATTTVLASSD